MIRRSRTNSRVYSFRFTAGYSGKPRGSRGPRRRCQNAIVLREIFASEILIFERRSQQNLRDLAMSIWAAGLFTSIRPYTASDDHGWPKGLDVNGGRGTMCCGRSTDCTRVRRPIPHRKPLPRRPSSQTSPTRPRRATVLEEPSAIGPIYWRKEERPYRPGTPEGQSPVRRATDLRVDPDSLIIINRSGGPAKLKQRQAKAKQTQGSADGGFRGP